MCVHSENLSRDQRETSWRGEEAQEDVSRLELCVLYSVWKHTGKRRWAFVISNSYWLCSGSHDEAGDEAGEVAALERRNVRIDDQLLMRTLPNGTWIENIRPSRYAM